ncbi:MAG: rhomboid family intramembrane serine protease [Nonomuraea sp.]|nr:rhomboid family intramembrane serine protease [Nonomuraea sp.]
MTSQPPSPPEQPAEAVPTCYRHPSKETWVRCQRCNRPICPDCMRDAAVGFQCPECVAQGNQGIRQARSAFGGSIVRTPYVTWTILGLLVVVFGAQLLTGNLVGQELGMWPIGVAVGEYWRLVTSAFVHDASGNFLHILFNGWAIFVIGPYLERAFGHLRYLAIFLISAVGGSVLSLWLDAPNTFTVGASGAVFGMFGAVLVAGRKLKLDVRGIMLVIVLNLVITFVFPGISWTGHIGGLITGTLLALALVYAPRKSQALWHALAIAGALALLVVLVMVRVPAIISILS